MEVVRYKYVFIVLVIMTTQISSEKSTKSKTHNTSTCPYTKIIEDIFKVNNKTSPMPISNSERAKLFLHSIAKVTDSNEEISQEELVNDIIAAINRIKNNITIENNTDNKLNEAIILEPNNNITDNNEKQKVTVQIKSGMEDKIDTKLYNLTKHSADSHNVKNDSSKATQITTENTNYIEVLTIEPNNTKNNLSSHNIIEVLKHLMPMFNSTLTKELHNITVIERNFNKNHSFSATKNVSTIVVTYCDKDNSSTNITFESGKETSLELGDKNYGEYDYYVENDDSENDEEDEEETASEKKEILEAAEYGMQRMHELYSVLEPKLYSMGLWLDDTNPARYVAAFNAPSEDSARFTRYGYASLQASAKLKQLTRSTCLEIRNIPSDTTESKTTLLNTFLNTAKALNIKLQQNEVKDIFRIKTKEPNNRTIIVELNSVLIKENIMTMFRKFNKGTARLSTSHLNFPGQARPVFISENLSFKMKRLHYLAREFAKANSYKFCWVSHGKIFLRKKENSPLIRVQDESTLEENMMSA